MQMRGVISPICHFLGKIMSLGLVFKIVHRRCTGNLVLNILRRDTVNKYCFDEDWVPVKL